MLWRLVQWYRAAGRTVPGACGTLMTNGWLPAALKELGVAFHRSPVGDRHVHAALTERGWSLGGEASGHILMLDRASTGDGLLTALCVAQALLETGTLADPLAGVAPFPHRLTNITVSERIPIEAAPSAEARIAEAEAALEEGRIVVRYSGTEPKLRIMIEGRDARQVDQWTECLARELPALLKEAKT